MSALPSPAPVSQLRTRPAVPRLIPVPNLESSTRLTWRFLVREYTKERVRGALGRWNLGLVRGPYDAQLCRMLDWLKADTVLDVGANIGQYGHSLIDSGFSGRVISCEPLSSAFSQLQRRADREPSWTAVNAAVGAAEGMSLINVAENSYSSSLLQVNSTHLAAESRSRTVSQETVPVTTVDSLVCQFGIDPARTLLKIDTQGFESQVLEGASGTLEGFAAVQLEMSLVPLYDSQQLSHHLMARMRSANFSLFSVNPGISDARTGRLLQADGLFVRDSLLAP